METTFIWTVFAIFYHFGLRKETFFQVNRQYLLATLLAGAAWPRMQDTPLVQWLAAQTGDMPDYAAWRLPEVLVGNTSGLTSALHTAGLTDLLLVGYVVGVAVTALRFVWGVMQLASLIHRSPHTLASEGCILCHSPAVELPFSFWHWIFLPLKGGADMNDMQQRAFLAHEQAHVRGRHTVDVLLAETVCILFWFHPLAYWYRRTLRQVHEYIADAAASRQLTRKQYGLLLIQQSYPGNMPALAHSFYQSPLQQRLIMLTKQHSPTIQGCKYLFILPLCVLCIWCCQKREDFTEKGASDGVERAAALPSASDHALELYQIQQLPEFEGGMTALMRYLGEHIQYPQEARAKKIEGKAAIQFIVEKDGSISQVEILKDVAGGCGAEAARVVASMPRWKPGLLEGRPVRVRYTLPVRFRLE